MLWAWCSSQVKVADGNIIGFAGVMDQCIWEVLMFTWWWHQMKGYVINSTMHSENDGKCSSHPAGWEQQQWVRCNSFIFEWLHKKKKNTYMWTGCGWQLGQTLSSLLTSSTVSGNHTAVLQAGKPTQDRYLLQGRGAARTGTVREGNERTMSCCHLVHLWQMFQSRLHFVWLPLDSDHFSSIWPPTKNIFWHDVFRVTYESCSLLVCSVQTTVCISELRTVDLCD